MNENPGALDVAEKFVSQSDTRMGARDETRDIGHHKLTFGVDGDNAEVRSPGGEWIIGDFGSRAGNTTEQCALAGVGFANQPDVGDRL